MGGFSSYTNKCNKMQLDKSDKTEKYAITRADAEENISTGEEKLEESQMPTRKPALNNKQILALLRRPWATRASLDFLRAGLEHQHYHAFRGHYRPNPTFGDAGDFRAAGQIGGQV